MSAGSIGLLWYLKYQHPEPSVRDAVRRSIEIQVERSGYVEQRSAICDALAAEQGTVLEPFVLDTADIDDAADLACLAAGASRELLVVSRDKLEPAGGLLLRLAASGPVARYSERRARTNRVTPGATWRFAPGLLPAPSEALRGVIGLTGRSETDTRGNLVRCGPFAMVGGTFPMAESIRIVAADVDVPGPKWHVEVARMPDGHYVIARPATPEDAIQLTALMIQRRWVTMNLTPDAPRVQKVAIRLALPGSGSPPELQVVPVLGDEAIGGVSRWLLSDNVPDVVVRFGPALVAEAGHWIGLASGWDTSSVLESIT